VEDIIHNDIWGDVNPADIIGDIKVETQHRRPIGEDLKPGSNVLT
jgi:hypothetical protein